MQLLFPNFPLGPELGLWPTISRLCCYCALHPGLKPLLQPVIPEPMRATAASSPHTLESLRWAPETQILVLRRSAYPCTLDISIFKVPKENTVNKDTLPEKLSFRNEDEIKIFPIIKELLTDWKKQIDSNAIMVENFNTPLSTMDRSSRLKINKKIMDVS